MCVPPNSWRGFSKLHGASTAVMLGEKFGHFICSATKIGLGANSGIRNQFNFMSDALSGCIGRSIVYIR